jgi:hypothetical protein
MVARGSNVIGYLGAVAFLEVRRRRAATLAFRRRASFWFAWRKVLADEQRDYEASTS